MDADPGPAFCKGLWQKDLDYLPDSKANTIGALLLHLAVTETHYQVNTFDAALGELAGFGEAEMGYSHGPRRARPQSDQGQRVRVLSENSARD